MKLIKVVLEVFLITLLAIILVSTTFIWPFRTKASILSTTTSSATIITSVLVEKANTVTKLSSTLNPSIYGQTITLVANVIIVPPSVGSPTGVIQFKDGANNLGSPVNINSSGIATVSTLFLTGGTHLITAVYSGDSNFNTSTSAVLTQIVNKTNVGINLWSNINPSTFGQSITLTAAITAVGNVPANPTGTVQFKDGANNLGSPVNLNGVIATVNTVSLSGGNHSITAVYSGNSNFNGSTSSILPQTVNRTYCSINVLLSPNPSVFGQTVNFTAQVSGAGPANPTGTIQFKDEANNLSNPISISNNGLATFSTNPLNPLTRTTHSITAAYSGDSNFYPNISALFTQFVNKANTAVTVISAQNPSAFGQAITFTANVDRITSGAGTLTGTIQFRDEANSLGTPISISNGQAQLTINSLLATTHSITAIYSGDNNFNGTASTILPQTVNKANTITSLTVNSSQVVFGQTSRLTATITSIAPGSGTPDGTVSFMEEANVFGTTTINTNGDALLNVVLTNVGNRSIKAIYKGSANFNASSSDDFSIFALTVDHNTLYVADTANNRIQRSTDNGQSWQMLGNGAGVGLGQFNAPRGVVANFADTVIFVADTANNRIQRSTNGGVSWTVIATAGMAINQVNKPMGLAYDEVNNKLYIADTMNNRILVVTNASTVTPSFAIFAGATAGTSIGKFNQPQSVTVNITGMVYVADTINNRVQVNNNSLETGWTVLAGEGVAIGQMKAPKGIYADNNGRIWIADTSNNRIQVNINGSWVMFMNSGTAVGLVNRPEGMVMTLSGNLFVADTGNNRIQCKTINDVFVVGVLGGAIGAFNQPSSIR